MISLVLSHTTERLRNRHSHNVY